MVQGLGLHIVRTSGIVEKYVSVSAFSGTHHLHNNHPELHLPSEGFELREGLDDKVGPKLGTVNGQICQWLQNVVQLHLS